MRRIGCLLATWLTAALVVAGVVVWAVVTAIGTVLGNALAGLGIVVLGLAVIAFLRGFGRVAGPLDELSEAAGRVADGDLGARVREPVRGPRPIRDLVRSFNTMADRLELDEAQRRSLLADVSHELRTPLAVITGNVEAMIDGVHPADPEHLSILLDEARTLTRLVEDLRTVALAEAGTLSLHREPTDVDALVGEVVSGFEAPATLAGVALDLEVPDDLPILELDAVRIREVLSNLLANAIRHTPSAGRVTITAGDLEGGVELRVVDTGPGIDPSVLPHLFERFAKGPRSRGSGLGLSIARSLVEAHGGTIGVRSAPGAGTTITVRLPAP